MNTSSIFPLDCLEDSQNKLIHIINNNKNVIDTILKEKDKTYRSFMRTLMDTDNKISDLFTPISHLHHVVNDEKTAQAFKECYPLVVEYSTDISQNKDIYEGIKYIKDNEYNTLDYAQKKVIDDYIFDFELSGVSLPDDKKEKIKNINIELSRLSDEFNQNIIDNIRSYQLVITDEDILGDMPANDKVNAKSENGWIFTLQAPSFSSFMKFVVDRKKREEMYRAYTTMAPKNEEIIGKILELRYQKAQILGFENYAELRNKNMSAPSVNAVISFLDTLAKNGKKYADKDIKALEEYARGMDNIDKIELYDLAYYSNKLLKDKYDFDPETLRPYFEKNQVVEGLFSLLNDMFDINFIKKDEKLWTEKAYRYDLYINNKMCGVIYLDLEARKGKNSGAWMNNWRTHHIDHNGDIHIPEVFVVCNFPQSTKEQPSLLRHGDVVTLFHEMGHALHHLMSSVNEYSVSGVNGVDWDVVEFPSQFLENFAYSRDVLNTIGNHYVTSEKIPLDVQDRLLEIRNFQAGYALMRQLEFSIFDMRIHMARPDLIDVQSTLDEVREELSPIIPPKYNKFQNSFSHIFSGGYASGYYSYKWAEMLSSDAYLAVEKNYSRSNELTRKYRDTVLALGGSMKMDNLYVMFLNQNPSPDSILELSGLLN